MDRRTLTQLGSRFEEFVRRLFERQGFEVRSHDESRGVDFVVVGSDTKAVVEVKLYSSIFVAAGNLLKALERLESARSSEVAPVGILAMNSRLSPEQRSFSSRFPSLKIYDFDTLAALAESDTSLAGEFETISRQALVFRAEDLPVPQERDALAIRAELSTPTESVQPPLDQEPAHPTTPIARGAELCAEINQVQASKGKPFEKACEAALKYLFEDELVAFDDQHASHTELHFFDLVARIASKEDFWQALITDFRARYVVFEFKNYKEEITQREIYTTEKYLYPVAMRGAAIIVSRHGADGGADKAMRGALRESGKLILSLSVDELCEMLHKRDAGSDFLSVLVGKLDTMLMGLER